MLSGRPLVQSLAELKANPEQAAAVVEKGHCVVLAGPGSGKTKTLTIAMARALIEDVSDPRGVACITYNNDCAIELETRLARLGIVPGDRAFIGTVHSFALSQVIGPYARCVPVGLPADFKVASKSQMRTAVEAAYSKTIDGSDNPHDRWKFASEKRGRDVDRTRPEWRGYNPELAGFIEAYEAELRRQGLIDFDIGTVHSFALSQVIGPYARCVPVGLPADFKVASKSQMRTAVEAAYSKTIDGSDNPHDRWKFASEKRGRDVDRTRPEWRGYNPELAGFIEAYEAELRRQGLIDFDDMPLIAYRMIKANGWIRDAVRARFPVLFVDEYQDLGHALHELVLLLCFEGGIRLFAVGDTDQSIYGFAGANPELLESLTRRPDVRTIRLRFNYRSGAKIIRASLGALGEERDYHGIDGAPDGDLSFWPVPFGHDNQADAVGSTIIPKLVEQGFELGQIAVLYRAAWLGDKVAAALKEAAIPFFRTDTNALVKRSSRLARFIEGCARWITGGWRDAEPPYTRLLSQAMTLVYGRHASEREEQELSAQLMGFLSTSLGSSETTHVWLQRVARELTTPWHTIARNSEQEWDVCDEMISNTDPARDLDMPLAHFAGRTEGSGRVNLSTLHSAKGREFDAVLMYGVNASDMPSARDQQSPTSLREARRLFYVGVTRPKKHLSLVYQEHHHSPWVFELYQRSQQN